MAPALNPYAERYYYQHLCHVQSVNFYNSPPPPPPSPCFFSQSNTTFYFHQYDHPCQFPITLLPNYSYSFAQHKPLPSHWSSASSAGFNLKASAAETEQATITKEDEEVLVKKEARSDKLKRGALYNRCQGVKFQKKRPSTFTSAGDEFQVKDLEDAVRRNMTTVMFKNIPNKLDKNYVLNLLDEHCLKVNKKLETDDGDSSSAFSEYNFLYLPMDFKTGCNYGFAFVNFNTPTAAYRFYQEFHNKSWAYLRSGKVGEVKYARIQGLTEHLRHFSNSIFSCASIEYLPVHFTPGRNGFGMHTSQQYIGKHYPEKN